VVFVLTVLFAVTGCSTVGGTGDRGYLSGNGQVSELPPAERGDPIELSGDDLGGDPVDVATLRGQVVVLNFWGSWCPPCRSEMPTLVDVAADPAIGAEFLGINVRDASVDDALSFERAYDVGFPTIWDPDGRALLSFPTALVRLPPTTLVLDRQGRVAAYVVGPLPSEITLRDLISKVVAEPPAVGDGPADG
jgi:thiol-disulfide isomerase/thioredoxin